MRQPYLVSYRERTKWHQHSLHVTREGGDLKFDGGFQSFFADPGDGGPNEYDWAEARINPLDMVRALHDLTDHEKWISGHLEITTAGGATTMTLGVGGLYSPGKGQATLSSGRRDLFVLDSYEAAYARHDEARTGIVQPDSEVDRAFISALRRNPARASALTTEGLERALLILVNEASDGDIDLVPADASGSTGLWLARPRHGSQAGMLIAIDESTDGVFDLTCVDRINGVRDRGSVSKAVVVTRSYFSGDVRREYAGSSGRLELVDFDRLSGLLSDSGWVCNDENFLMCPMGSRSAHSIFISYSHDQRDFAVWLYNRLTAANYSCFLDSVSMAPGEIILPSLEKALNEVDLVLLCVSKSSLTSPWVQAEIEYCVEREKWTNTSLLVPLRLDDHPLPGELSSRLYVDFRHWRREDAAYDGLERLHAALVRLDAS